VEWLCEKEVNLISQNKKYTNKYSHFTAVSILLVPQEILFSKISVD